MVVNNNLQMQINELQAAQDKRQKDTKNEQLSRELYSKRFNYLIHGLPESNENAWETCKQTEKFFHNFLIEGLHLDNSHSIELADIHRLPQHPIYDSEHRRINKPIIVKFTNIFDKHKFTQNLKNLKLFNQQCRSKSPTINYVHATEHLPKEIQWQKKKLIKAYKAARKEKDTLEVC